MKNVDLMGHGGIGDTAEEHTTLTELLKRQIELTERTNTALENLRADLRPVLEQLMSRWAAGY
jgi:hypothetical protein